MGEGSTIEPSWHPTLAATTETPLGWGARHQRAFTEKQLHPIDLPQFPVLNRTTLVRVPPENEVGRHVRNPAESPLRISSIEQISGLYTHHRPHPGPRHRRHYRDFFAHRRYSPAPAPIQ